MSTKSYGTKLKDPRWQKKRLQIFNRDKWRCTCCGDAGSTLNVHHLKYFGDPWECPDEFLTTLCEDCHEIVTVQGHDLCTDVVEIRKLQRPTHMTFFSISKEGVMLYMRKPGGPLECHGGASHDVVRYIVHDILNYWLKTDNEHYLTENLKVAHG